MGLDSSIGSVGGFIACRGLKGLLLGIGLRVEGLRSGLWGVSCSGFTLLGFRSFGLRVIEHNKRVSHKV